MGPICALCSPLASNLESSVSYASAAEDGLENNFVTLTRAKEE